jgi:glycosyltransferase involved in cell wall biosynthesis
LRLLLILNNVWPPPVATTAAGSLYGVARELARSGHDLHVLTSVGVWDHARRPVRFDHKTISDWFEQERREVGVVFHPMDFSRLWRLPRAAVCASRLLSVPRAIGVIARHRIELVHEVSNNPVLMRKTALLGRAAGVAAVHTICGIPRGPLASFRWVASGVRGLDTAITTTRTVAQRLRATGFPGHKIEVVSHAVRSGAFTPSADLTARARSFRREHGIGLRAPVALFLGPLERRKGPHFFLAAAARVAERAPKAVFVLATGPAFAPNIEQRTLEAAVRRGSAKLGKRLIVLEGIHDVPGLMSAADVVALPHIGDDAATPPPVTLLEAMCAGVPALVSRTAGMDEFVRDGETGYLVAPADAEALACKLGELMGDVRLRRRIGEAARRAALAHDVLRVARHLEEVFERVLDERARGK